MNVAEKKKVQEIYNNLTEDITNYIQIPSFQSKCNHTVNCNKLYMRERSLYISKTF